MNILTYSLVKTTYMQKRCLNNFTQLLNLFFASSNVSVSNVGLILHLHHRYRGIDFRWKWDMDLILVTINPKKTIRKYRNLNAMSYTINFITYPTLIPSSISVGATESAKSTTNFANCFTLMMYLGSSFSKPRMIFVHRATWKL